MAPRWVFTPPVATSIAASAAQPDGPKISIGASFCPARPRLGEIGMKRGGTGLEQRRVHVRVTTRIDMTDQARLWPGGELAKEGIEGPLRYPRRLSCIDADLALSKRGTWKPAHAVRAGVSKACAAARCRPCIVFARTWPPLSRACHSSRQLMATPSENTISPSRRGDPSSAPARPASRGISAKSVGTRQSRSRSETAVR